MLCPYVISSSQIYIFRSSPPTQSLSTYNDDVLSYDPSGLRSYLIGKLTVSQRTGWREPVQKKPSDKSKQKQQKHYLCSLLLQTRIKKKSEMHFSMNCEIPVMIRNNKGKVNLFGAYHPCTRPSCFIYVETKFSKLFTLSGHEINCFSGSRSLRTHRAQRGSKVMTKSQIFSRSAVQPHSVNKLIINIFGCCCFTYCGLNASRVRVRSCFSKCLAGPLNDISLWS